MGSAGDSRSGDSPRASAPEHGDAAEREAARGSAAYKSGRYQEAFDYYNIAVRRSPAEPDYHYWLALSAWRASRLAVVQHHLQEAVRLNERHALAHEALGQWYLNQGAIAQADFHSARAIQLDHTAPEIIVSRALALEAGAQTQQACELIQPLLDGGFCSARLAVLYGRLAPRLKQEPRAMELIGRALASPPPVFERTLLHFTAASVLDRMGRYDEAFEHARSANELSRRPYDPRRNTYWIDQRIEYFTREKLEALPRASHRTRRPVFVIGMPRSGTSLIEQVLASHPQIYGAGELDTLRLISVSAAKAEDAEGELYPECLDALSLRLANQFADEYLAALSALDDKATYVTDKMPMNFRYLGLINVLFPDAPVIHCTRDPLDTCLSCYFTDFVFGHEFTNDLTHLGLFYGDYLRVMDHWKKVLGFPMLEMRYEDVVQDLEGQTRRMLDYLQLPWDPNCLRFHENKRHVATASSEQVRRPIYASSVGRWKHYEKHLSPLMEALAVSR